ncbi:MAG: stage 0 sporulation protein [Ruminococcaceae bacterium]|nr:stage 0 sporulation protein [Oscillospiraceae bacterium]
MVNVVGVRFKDTGKTYHFDPCGIEIHTGSNVIVETSRGLEFGKAATGIMQIPDDEVVTPLKPIKRIATKEDVLQLEKNKELEKQAYSICLKKIEAHKLEMDLTEAEYTFDRSKIIFYFTADGRVDFRELVKDLANEFHTRIELRQIGVRDEAKLLGGLGICGRPFCCSTFLNDFHSVSIKMAKVQGLSLSPGKISGCCGRLMCCLQYEQNSYEHLNKVTPAVGTRVSCRSGKGVVVDRAVLTGTLKVQLDDMPEGAPIVVNKDDVKPIKTNPKEA